MINLCLLWLLIHTILAELDVSSVRISIEDHANSSQTKPLCFHLHQFSREQYKNVVSIQIVSDLQSQEYKFIRLKKLLSIHTHKHKQIHSQEKTKVEFFLIEILIFYTASKVGSTNENLTKLIGRTTVSSTWIMHILKHDICYKTIILNLIFVRFRFQ